MGFITLTDINSFVVVLVSLFLATESISVQGKVFPSFKVPEDRKGMYD